MEITTQSFTVSVSTVEVRLIELPLVAVIFHPDVWFSQEMKSISVPELSLRVNESPLLPSSRFRLARSELKPYSLKNPALSLAITMNEFGARGVPAGMV